MGRGFNGFVGIALVCGLLGQVAIGDVARAETPSEWQLKFDYEEFFARGDEPRHKLEFAFDTTGHYEADLVAFNQNDEMASHAEQAGQLTQEQLDNIANWITELGLTSVTNEQLDIGYGLSLVPGWQGAISVTQSDTQSVTQFTSLRPATHPERSVRMNRLVTFVFDLKRLALHELNADKPAAEQ